MKDWTRFRPVFGCDEICRPLYAAAPWAGHRPFVYDYVRNICPPRVVELGIHYGCSAFCFLQAVQDGALPVDVTLIDSWQGDPYTEHDYRDGGVRELFEYTRREKYGRCPVTIRAERFEDAVRDLPDGSISLLHIDGSHTYADVRRDYRMWERKVEADGTIFFHDVTARLGGTLLGSAVFWKEVQKTEPYTLTIPFSCGLGILCRSRARYLQLREVLDGQYYESLYEEQTEQIKADLREAYFVNRPVGDRPGQGHGSISGEVSAEHRGESPRGTGTAGRDPGHQ